MHQRFSLFLSVLVLGFGLAVSDAGALQANDPSALINNLVEEAISVIKDPKVTEAAREKTFSTLLEQGFDIPRIARFVMGRYWNSASEQERQKFTNLFQDWIVRTYAARFNSYSGQTIKVTGTRSESDISTVVLSQFINPDGGAPAKVEWRVRKGNDGVYKVVDVSVEGISMALTQRDEIAAVADRSGGTAASLNSALEQRIASGVPAPGAVPAEGRSR